MNKIKNTNLTYIIFTLVIMGMMVATGIGRFVFTPIIPIMLAENTIKMSEVIWLSSANYIGYFFGAISLFKNTRHILMLLLGLFTVTFATLLSSLDSFSSIFFFRFLAGIGGAWTLISISAWSIPKLTALKVEKVGLIYTGVGAGIALSGIVCSCLILLNFSATELWYAIAIISLLLSISVSLMLYKIKNNTTDNITDVADKIANDVNHDEKLKNTNQDKIVSVDISQDNFIVWRLAVAYGLFGFGYIIPATFLPKMAKDMLEGNIFLFIWPLFGLASIIAVVATQFFTHISDIKIWRVAQTVTGLATLLPIMHSSITVLFMTTLLIGGAFMVVIMSILKIAANMKRNYNVVALMTASFAFGQLAGPLPALFLPEDNIWDYVLPLSAFSSLLGVIFLWKQDKKASITV